MKITIRPLTPSLWPDLEALFGRSGASNGCWCMYWRIGPEYHKRPREKNRIAFRKKGVMASLIREALKTAKRANVPAVEAYPVDTTRPGSTSNVFTGTASTF